jgi:hypothetical protein
MKKRSNTAGNEAQRDGSRFFFAVEKESEEGREGGSETIRIHRRDQLWQGKEGERDHRG